MTFIRQLLATDAYVYIGWKEHVRVWLSTCGLVEQPLSLQESRLLKQSQVVVLLNDRFKGSELLENLNRAIMTRKSVLHGYLSRLDMTSDFMMDFLMSFMRVTCKKWFVNVFTLHFVSIKRRYPCVHMHVVQNQRFHYYYDNFSIVGTKDTVA